jgi:phosphatidylglycerol---prolipoprotein diacylglyceryl transferase
MIYYPQIDPIALNVGPLKIHWYGVMYLIGFLSAWALAIYRIKKYKTPLTTSQVPDLIFYLALSAIIGGRLGFALIYNFQNSLTDPFSIFKIWEGGMSFHGGLIGVLLGAWLFSYKIKKPFLAITDFVAPLVPIGLAAGRLGNFINGELYGRISDVPWAMVFPHGGPYSRHPSQLYEFFSEGILLFIVLWLYSAKPRPRMAVSGLFLIGYGLARSVSECFRKPDDGFIAFDWLTMGQLLSFPMLLIGIFLFILAYQKGEK